MDPGGPPPGLGPRLPTQSAQWKESRFITPDPPSDAAGGGRLSIGDFRWSITTGVIRPRRRTQDPPLTTPRTELCTPDLAGHFPFFRRMIQRPDGKHTLNL